MTDRKNLLVDRDTLMNADRTRVARVCVHLFDSVQDQKKEDQLLGLMTAAVLISEASGHDPQEVYRAALNLMADRINSTGREARFDAMKFHLTTEVLTDDA